MDFGIRSVPPCGDCWPDGHCAMNCGPAVKLPPCLLPHPQKEEKMRNISFSMTTPQYKDGSKDITRRVGWWNLKPGDRLRAVEKAMGLKKGEKIKPLGVIEVISVRRERLDEITQDDCRREGFPDWTPAQFVAFFCRGKSGLSGATEVNRIEFKRAGE